jgi:hypothetical protein
MEFPILSTHFFLSLSTSVNNITTPDCGIFQQKINGFQQASDGGTLKNRIKPTKASDTKIQFGVQSPLFSPRREHFKHVDIVVVVRSSNSISGGIGNSKNK